MVSSLVFTYSMLESDYNVMLIEIYLGRIYIIVKNYSVAKEMTMLFCIKGL